jgi:LSD1 subclass zinc finger protein
MAGLMQWFQVTCPKCTGALQVRLPEGVTSVQCSQCKAVFAVQVQPVALAPPGGPAPPPKRSRKRKKELPGGMGEDPSSQPTRTLSAYNVFMKSEVAKVKAEHPTLAHREAFKLAAERWQASPMNPQNGGERFPLKHGAEGGAARAPDTSAEAAARALAGGALALAAASGAGAYGGAGLGVGADGGDDDEEEEEDDGEEDDDDGPAAA